MGDSEWYEVKFINGYAVFMGYLMMGIRGLGVLVATWTTVVLLGGFVTNLGTKDFWCLTGITLVQTAGVFNIVLKQKLSDFAHSWRGLLGIALATIAKPLSVKDSVWRPLLAWFLSGIQALEFIIILCPVAVLYVFGICISAGVGLWRLVEHDFDNNNAQGEGTHLKPALQVLYSLAVAQGLIYGYKTVHAFGVKLELAKLVAGVVGPMEKDLVLAYLNDTVAGCEKDPSFATGRNFLTYAVDLMMDTKSTKADFITGVKILGTVILDAHAAPGRQDLAKHLLTRPSSSFSQMIERLLETMGPRSPDSLKTMVQAAGIVALVADGIHLEEHPGWIHYISYLVLDTSKEYEWRHEKYKQRNNLSDFKLHEDDYRSLVGQVFNILAKLAVHQNNCQVIMNIEGLLSKIMAPLNSEELHRNRHELWATIAQDSQKLVMHLAAVPGETGIMVGNKILQNSKSIITTLESILECPECEVDLQRSTVEIVLDLSVDTSSMTEVTSGNKRCRILKWMHLLIFLIADEEVRSFDTPTKNRSQTGKLAGKKLSSNKDLSLEESASSVLGELTAALQNAGGDISTSLHAAKILDYLCLQYKKMHDQFLIELMNSMVSMMEEVLKEILDLGRTVEAATKAANNTQSSFPNHDLEEGGGESCEQTSSTQQQKGHKMEEIKRLHKELTELCRTIKNEWYREDIYVERKQNDIVSVKKVLDDIAKEVCPEQGKKSVKTFRELVRDEMKKHEAKKAVKTGRKQA